MFGGWCLVVGGGWGWGDYNLKNHWKIEVSRNWGKKIKRVLSLNFITHLIHEMIISYIIGFFL